MRTLPFASIPPAAELVPGLAASATFRLVSRLVADWVGARPYEARFRAAMRLAWPLSGAMWIRERAGLSHMNHGHYGRALGMVCLMLHHQRVTYPVPISIDSDGPLDGPLLMVVRHSLANQFLIRDLIERGRAVSVLVAPPIWLKRAFGTDTPIDAVAAAGPMRLRTLANLLRDGRIVFVAIDSKLPKPGIAVRVDTPSGPWFLADQPARLAARLGVPLASAVIDASRAGVTADVRYSRGTTPEQLLATCAAAFGSGARLSGGK